jgi:hypothetical protein
VLSRWPILSGLNLWNYRLRRYEFNRAAALGSSTPTGRGHTHLTGQRGPGVDVLYRIASRAPGQKSTESGMERVRADNERVSKLQAETM